VAERAIQIVYSRPFPGKDDEYNDWYDNTHLPDVLAVPGVVSAQRYDLRPLAREEGTEPEYRYVTIYEIDGDPEEVMAKFGAGVASGEMVLSPAFDVAGTKISFWSPHGAKGVSG
jgi:hypothetical protein